MKNIMELISFIFHKYVRNSSSLLSQFKEYKVIQLYSFLSIRDKQIISLVYNPNTKAPLNNGMKCNQGNQSHQTIRCNDKLDQFKL